MGIGSLQSCDFFSKKPPTGKATEASKSNEIIDISKQINENPKESGLYFKRGNRYRLLKEDSLALLDYKKAISIDTTQAKYYSALADLLFDHKDVTGSLTYIQKAIQLDPLDEVAHLKMARMFLFTEEYSKSFVEINTVLRKNVHNAEAYFLKGMCYKYMKDTSRAISSWQTAVQTEPRYAEAHLQLALIHEARKDLLALNYYENAYQADTSDLEPLYGKAMFWQNQHNYKEAKSIFTRMILLDRNYPKSFYNMGWMLMQEDSIEKAIRQFTIAIEVQPDYAEAYYNRGICQEIQENFNAAKIDYEQAENFRPELTGLKAAQNRLQQKMNK
jgi:tetratricopeptide (TPR) repeat protein